MIRDESSRDYMASIHDNSLSGDEIGPTEQVLDPWTNVPAPINILHQEQVSFRDLVG